MKTIRDIALEVEARMRAKGLSPAYHAIDFAESVLAEYLAQQEPVATVFKDEDVIKFIVLKALPSTGNWQDVYLAPPIPAGMQLVPIEPTKKMQKAALSASDDVFGVGIYKAMLAAAKESHHAE